MKRLSDYKGEEALELWAKILDPTVEIVGDERIGGMIRAKVPKIIVAKEAIKAYPKQVSDLLLAIDPTPIDGLNIVTRLLSVLKEISEDETIQSFFGVSAENTEETPSGSAMENTEEGENQGSSSDI